MFFSGGGTGFFSIAMTASSQGLLLLCIPPRYHDERINHFVIESVSKRNSGWRNSINNKLTIALGLIPSAMKGQLLLVG